MKRRKLIELGSLISAASIVSIGTHGWVARGFAQKPNSKRLIVVFLRGAVELPFLPLHHPQEPQELQLIAHL
ncbi:MAG: hypothetical protein GDA56_11585 [Hormoscilla sp. GM7CHS1pb]|nr:hypothetical protein [Hormoscilla sp. GM7CHS1pb]